MNKHTILFLAANPHGTNRLALDQEASSIRKELKRSGYREHFELVTRWAVEPLDLLRDLRELKPAVVHFSGHGNHAGLAFQGASGNAQMVSPAAIAETFGAAGGSVKVVVLSACYSDATAESLLAHVDYVVGMSGALHDESARAFATGFYGALGEFESVAAAYRHGNAAISLEGLPEADRPRLSVRDGVDINKLALSADSHPSVTAASATVRTIAPRAAALGQVVVVENNYGRIIIGDSYPRLLARAAISGLFAGMVLLLDRYAVPAAIVWFGAVTAWLFKKRKPQQMRAAGGDLVARSIVGVSVAAAVAVSPALFRAAGTESTDPDRVTARFPTPEPKRDDIVDSPTLPQLAGSSSRAKDPLIAAEGRDGRERSIDTSPALPAFHQQSYGRVADYKPLVSPGIEFRIATLAPPGSPWMEVLDKAANETKEKTAGRVTLKYLVDDQQDDERDLVRKINLGQLEGAAVTAVGLSMIDESVRVLELPMMFESAEEFDYVADELWPYFQKKFEKKGFKLNNRGEVGWIYFLSKSKVEQVADLQGLKLWMLGDDRLIDALFKKLGLNSLPLSVPEVDAALTSGKIDACYGSPVATVALQWYSKVKFMTSMPMNFALGATVISVAAYNKLSTQDANVLEDVSWINARKLRKTIRNSNEDAKGTMTRKGVTVVQPPIAMIEEFTKNATELWHELAGKMYSKEELAMVLKVRDEYRANNKSRAISPAANLSCGARAFEFRGTQTFAHLLASADPSSARQIQLVQSYAELTRKTIHPDERFHVYVDSASGAGFIVPSDFRLAVIGNDCVARDAAGELEMRISTEAVSDFALTGKPATAFTQRMRRPAEIVEPNPRFITSPAPRGDGMMVQRYAFFYGMLGQMPPLNEGYVTLAWRRDTLLGVSVRSLVPALAARQSSPVFPSIVSVYAATFAF